MEPAEQDLKERPAEDRPAAADTTPARPKAERRDAERAAVEFLPDADELEARPLPLFARATLFILLGLIAVAVLYAALFSVDRVVVAQGRLVTRDLTLVVQPFTTSVLRELRVRIGDRVEEGQVLALLDPTFAEADVSQTRAREQALTLRIRRLRAELNGDAAFPRLPDDPAEDYAQQHDVFLARLRHRTAREEYFAHSIDGIERQMAALTADAALLQERLGGMREVEQMRQELFKQDAGSRLQILMARDSRLDISSRLQSVQGELRGLEARISSLQAERAAFIGEWRQQAGEELLEAEEELARNREQLVKARRMSDLAVLRAPSNGIVLEIAERSVGSVLKEAEPLITLVPVDAPLEAEVQILPRDIGYLQVNQPARVKIEAFPYQKHGVLAGTLSTISADAFAGGRGGADSGGGGGGADGKGAPSFFRGRVTLEGNTLRNVPEGTDLLPGMTLSAEIVVGRRTILSYFLYPLTRAFDESFREP